MDDQESVDLIVETMGKIYPLVKKAIVSNIHYKQIKTSILVTISTNPKYETIRWKALELMRESSIKNLVPILQKIMNSAENDSPLQCNAACALGFLGTEYSVWPLIDNIYKMSESQRDAFAIGLERADTPIAYQALNAIRYCLST